MSIGKWWWFQNCLPGPGVGTSVVEGRPEVWYWLEASLHPRSRFDQTCRNATRWAIMYAVLLPPKASGTKIDPEHQYQIKWCLINYSRFAFYNSLRPCRILVNGNNWFLLVATKVIFNWISCLVSSDLIHSLCL